MTTRSELKRLAEALISANESYLADGCNIEKQNAFHDADDALQDALPPEEVLALIAEIERLRGIQPDLPPRPPEGDGLPRCGLRWNGPGNPLTTPMDDGYWTPWHLADQLKAENEALLAGMTQIMRETRMGDPAFAIACEVVGELSDAAMGKGEQS